MNATKQTFPLEGESPTYKEVVGLASNDDVVIQRFIDEGFSEGAILYSRILALNALRDQGFTLENENGEEIDLPSMSELKESANAWRSESCH